MISNSLKLFLAILVLSGQVMFAQKNNPEKILDRVKQKFLTVKDYEVNVKIKIDVEFLKIPENKAKIYFKQPDKVKINSEGFALLPKEGINFSPISLLSGNRTSIFEKEEVIDGTKLSVLKIIPLGGTDDIILSTLWIDDQKSIIRKVESTTKTNGTFTIDLNYNESLTKYPLPSSLVFTFDVSRSNIPITLDDEPNSKQDKLKKHKLTKGTVKILYSEYKVNINVPDSIFEEKEKSKNK